MALYTYDGPYAEVELRVAGHDVGFCEKGGSIVVPDELASQVEWPDYWTRADKNADKKDSGKTPVTISQVDKEGV